MHDTLKAFNANTGTIKDYKHWTLVIRPVQITFGSMVLISKSDVQSISDLNEASFKELKIICQDIEIKLKSFLRFDKINYLALMMVDKQVHFHILPRYAKPLKFSGLSFIDEKWPGPPDLSLKPLMEEATIERLKVQLRKLLDFQDEEDI